MLYFSRFAFRSFHFLFAKNNCVEFSACNFPKTIRNLGPCMKLSSRKNNSIKPFSVRSFSISGSINNQEMNESLSCISRNVNIEGNYEEIFKEIANGDPATENKLKVIAFEIAIFREHGRIPTNIKKEHWLELLKLKSISSKKKYLNYLFVIEKKEEHKISRKDKRRESNLKQMEDIAKDKHCVYGFTGNTMFMRVYNQSLLKMLCSKLAGALLYSQDILFDCSYDDYMSLMNSKYCAKQIVLSISYNRIHPAPVNLKLCNVNPNDSAMKFLKKMLASPETENSLLFNAVPDSYLDLYPKEKLVYLSPHCKNVLHEYNHDDIYIIGAFVDRGTGKKVSLAKAKENNLRMAKLPLDYYLDWQRGMKSLPLNIMLSILLDMRLYNDWNRAFQNIPLRFTYKND